MACKSGQNARRGGLATRLLAVPIILLATGCATEGAYLKTEQVDEIKASVTTATELEATLGIPSVTVPRDDGNIMWVYEGIHVRADPTQYIPYLNFLVGTNSKFCTRLTVLVDRETGALSDWDYKTGEDTDFWAKTDDRCQKAGRGRGGANSAAAPSDP